MPLFMRLPGVEKGGFGESRAEKFFAQAAGVCGTAASRKQ